MDDRDDSDGTPSEARVLMKYVDRQVHESLTEVLKSITRSPKAKEFLKPVADPTTRCTSLTRWTSA